MTLSLSRLNTIVTWSKEKHGSSGHTLKMARLCKNLRMKNSKISALSKLALRVWSTTLDNVSLKQEKRLKIKNLNMGNLTAKETQTIAKAAKGHYRANSCSEIVYKAKARNLKSGVELAFHLALLH